MRILPSSGLEQFESVLYDAADKLGFDFSKIIFDCSSDYDSLRVSHYGVVSDKERLTFYHMDSSLIVNFKEMPDESVRDLVSMMHLAHIGLSGLKTLEDVAASSSSDLHLPLLENEQEVKDFVSLLIEIRDSYLNLEGAKLWASAFGKSEIRDYLRLNIPNINSSFETQVQGNIHQQEPFSNEIAFYSYQVNSFYHAISGVGNEKKAGWITGFSSMLQDCFGDIKDMQLSWPDTMRLLAFTLYGIRSRGDIPNSVAYKQIVQPYESRERLFFMQDKTICTMIISDESAHPTPVSTANMFGIYQQSSLSAANKIGVRIIDYLKAAPKVDFDAY